jgi:hypothetical protein
VPGGVALTFELGSSPSGITYHLWVGDGPDLRRAGEFTLPPNSFLTLLSADERTALAVVGDDEFQVWDLSDPAAPRRTATMADWPFPEGIDAAGTLMTAVENGAAVYWRPGDTTRTRLPGNGVENVMPLHDGTGVVLVRRVDDRRDVEVRSLDGRVTPVLSRTARLALVTGPGGRLAVSDLDGAHLTVLDAVGVDTAGGHRTLLEADAIPKEAVVEFSHDGQAVTALHRGSVWLWDLTGGREPLSLRVPGMEFSAVRYEPADGELLMLESRKGVLWHLAMDVDRVVRDVCADPADVDWAAHFPGVPEQPVCP